MARSEHPTSSQGILPAIRTRLFGERDVVAERLRDLERQGSHIARLAHFAATLLVVLFSLGSLTALSGTALQRFQSEWTHGGIDIPSAISIGVSTLFVVAMDIGIVYAARTLRVLATRRSDARSRWLHIVVIAGVCMVEAATYIYMSWRYDHPDNVAVWGLIIVRGVSSPLMAVYLSVAQPLPIGPRDVLYQVEYGAGAGLIRDVTMLANDPDASLERKAQLYNAAATVSTHDSERLQRLIAALATGEPREKSNRTGLQSAASSGSGYTMPPGARDHHATGSIRHRLPTSRRHHGGDGGDDGEVDADDLPVDNVRSNVRTLYVNSPSESAGAEREVVRRADTGMSQGLRLELSAHRREAVRQIVQTDPTIGVRELARRIERATGRRISESTATSLLAQVRAEPQSEAQVEEADPSLGVLAAE